MIDRHQIESLVNDATEGTGIFIVDIKVSASNRITVVADTMKGITIDECSDLHRNIEKNLDREAEDFELQVSSPGLDMPFRVAQQYLRNEGMEVEVTDNDGMKFRGILRNVTAGGFELETDIKVKGKPKEKKELSFNFDQVKKTMIVLNIK
jgi:ribosome maturation factor RimP